MYIVRDKVTRKIIYINPAPISQELEGQDVYYQFDPNRMEIGKTNSSALPEYFNINAASEIIELTPAEKAEAGLLTLALDEKIDAGQIVKKTLSEQLSSGLLTLLPTQKISGKGDDEQIVNKTLSEQVAEGFIKLAPNQKLVKDEIAEKTETEMIKQGLLTLDDVKQRKIQFFSDMALEKRAALLPDYKLQNALLGIYDEQTVANYKTTVLAFRDEFYRLQKLIEKSKTLKKIEAVTENFPKEIIVTTPG